MMKYPIGIQSFPDLRENGYVYVDKSALLYQLATTGKYYFLSRPRRFGKSLLVSMMEAYFLGKKELFEGLAMERLETEWKKHLVLRLDLNRDAYNTPENLEQVLNKSLSDWEAIYGKDPAEVTLALRFGGIVQRACERTGEQVVILVDEYDKPLLQTIDKPELHEAYRNTLKAFYGVLKSQDQYIHFGFLTGVTKFSHVSIFSDLNNLNDISMDESYADICGISENELHAYFEESISELAIANKITREEACDKLRKQYDGYHFCENSVGIYNPFSLLNTFSKRKFNDYWFSTGTPTFLTRMLQANDYELDAIDGWQLSKRAIFSSNTDTLSPISVLYQSGYLTIKDYDKEDNLYTLGFPNKEVEMGFTQSLVPAYTSVRDEMSDALFMRLSNDIKRGDAESMLLRLQSMLADNDYRVAGKKELYFQNTLSVIFRMLGFKVDVERATSNGRIDITIHTKDYVYLMELKLDGTAEEALRQIKDKQYARPFQLDGRKLYLIGVNFSSKTRTIEEWVIE